MRAALSKHDLSLQTAIESHDGFLFSHTGDGVVAAFASPRSAVDAAVKAQLGLELPVRMGIATGGAELRGNDYFGTVLNRAARVMAAGHGGQILVADSTAGLLSGVDLLDLGPRRLRDVPMPVGVFQVRSAGLRVEFPPLRALDTTPGNLRPATTSLIGRESDVDAITTAVRSHRLVTLTGVGGVGKTRLALEVAAQLADEFPDGVWVFELAAVTDPASVPDAVAAVLGVSQQLGKTVSESVAAALEGRSRLLVFDNCEHVLDAAADIIEAIRGHSASVRILATSREGLGVAEEQLWPVSSLDVAAGVDLFIERARSVAPDFAADNSVAQICKRLDGIPLAIELAASRLSSMTADEIHNRLDHRFKLLVGSRRGLERHQTLRHAVTWSYELLDDAERELLTRCSVFVGGFDVESACAISASAGGASPLSWIGSTRWCASRCWWRIGRRPAHGFRCWRPSASSPRKDSTLAVMPMRSGGCMPATSRGAKPRSCPYGTAPNSGSRIPGFSSNWLTFGLLFGGPPTTATAIWPPPSPPAQRLLAPLSKTMSPRSGPKKSSPPQQHSTIGGLHSYA